MGRSTGTFQLPPLVPGTYTVVVDQAPAQYQAPTLPTVRLLPGADVDVGELLFTFVGVGDEGPGRISGEVRTAGGAAGQHRVTLFRRSGNTTVFVRSVVTDGAFDFAALALGSYAVVVESEGFTPVYRLGVTVAAQDDGEARLQHQLAGDTALVVHPVTAALQPSLGDGTVVLDEGLVFVRGDSAPLLVLPFVTRADLELGITGMRLSTDASFLDANDQPVPFVLGHGAALTFEAVAFDVVANRRSVTRTVTLDLRGTVSGAVGSDAVPGVIDSVAGAVVALIDSRGTVVGGPTTVDASGDFLFPGVIEGRGYSVRATLAGHQDAVARNIAVDVDAAVDLGDVALALSRGALRGRALRSDVVAYATAHAGIAVTASLVSPTRAFSETVVTDAAGNWTLRGVPRTLDGEVITLSAQAEQYGLASCEVLLSAAVVTAADLLLPRGRGDFDVCRTADPGCTPAQFFAPTPSISVCVTPPTSWPSMCR